jgi:hypothetical protein
VPIRDGDQVVGVLGMSIEIAAFEALRLDSDQQRTALLIDARPDWKGDRGIVLFHGRQAARGRSARQVPNERWPVIDSADLAEMLNPQTSGRVRSGVLPRFRDPQRGPWEATAAGFAPVWVRPDRQQSEFSGWLVLVCEAER